MSAERYDETNHLDLTHAPSLTTYIGKTLASYVSGNRMLEISGDNRKRIPDHIRARYDRDCERLAEEVLRYITKAAPASPLPGGGWQDVSTFTESGQGSPVIVAVPTKEGGWIVGEAWKSVMEPDDPYRGNDGWWWAGTSPGDAYNDPIRFMNHGDAEWWMPLPAAPTGDA